MTQEHPIIPPKVLAESLRCRAPHTIPSARELWLINHAYAAGADQELEACEKYWMTHGISPEGVAGMRAARRPKPLSDKEHALRALSLIMSRQKGIFDGKPFETVRKALEALPNG